MINTEETFEERIEGIKKAAVKDAIMDTKREHIVSLHENGFGADEIVKLLRESRSFVEDCLRGVK